MAVTDPYLATRIDEAVREATSFETATWPYVGGRRDDVRVIEVY